MVEMLTLLLIFGLNSISLPGIAVGALLTGIVVLLIRKTRIYAPFLLVPFFGAIAAVALSWGFFHLTSSMAETTTNINTWEIWQVISTWMWPFGLLTGGLLGASNGVLISLPIYLKYRKSK